MRDLIAAKSQISGCGGPLGRFLWSSWSIAEFSGFLLYEELGRRLKKTNPVVAEIFSLMSRDEARHAGFLNKGLSDFNLDLDLGSLTKARKYTFFNPKFIFYATYLSEKIGYWRYITIYRHLKANPGFKVYPIFKYIENWCRDENRHGGFFSAFLKAQPQFLSDGKAKLWSRFFCLSVYVTMYLNDCQRTAFFEGIGLDTKEFDIHVIIETNRTTARIFPAVLGVENPEFKRKLDRVVEINQKLIAIGESQVLLLVKNLKRIPARRTCQSLLCICCRYIWMHVSLYLMSSDSKLLFCISWLNQIEGRWCN
ncbi:unnamed protein product [Musa acuminata var. zebrina]